MVRLSDDQLFECPILVGSDVGTAGLSDTEVQRLRQYLLKGGFLWVDDFWGTPAWKQWTSQIARVLPEFPIVDVDPVDPIRHAMFTIAKIKQIPSIFAWGGPGATLGSAARTVRTRISAPSPTGTAASWWR